MNAEEIIKNIAVAGTENWHCYDTLKYLLNSNEELRILITKGILENKITGFGEELWKKLGNQNLRAKENINFLDVLKDGYNQGYCTVTSKQVSYSLNDCYICGGVLPILKNTINCPDGSHTWIEQSNCIIDTTLMLIIKKEFKDLFGYIEENKYDPKIDAIYNATKEFTNDLAFKKR